jgi:hypothetical protein
MFTGLVALVALWNGDKGMLDVKTRLEKALEGLAELTSKPEEKPDPEPEATTALQEPPRKNEINEVSSPPGPAEPKIEVSPEKLAEFAPDIAAFTEAGFRITRISSGKKPKGITMDEWRLREAKRMATEHLGTLHKLPRNVHRRARGETALYYSAEGPFEWIFAPQGLQDSTWTQITEESKTARIQVVSWPTGNLIFDSATSKKE